MQDAFRLAVVDRLTAEGLHCLFRCGALPPQTASSCTRSWRLATPRWCGRDGGPGVRAAQGLPRFSTPRKPSKMATVSFPSPTSTTLMNFPENLCQHVSTQVHNQKNVSRNLRSLHRLSRTVQKIDNEAPRRLQTRTRAIGFFEHCAVGVLC